MTRDVSEEFKTRAKLEGDVDLRDEFLAIASHELRTPLTSLKLAASLYLRSHPSPHREFATKVSRSVDQLTRLVGDMLDVSRIDRGNMNLDYSPQQLDSLLNQVVSEVGTIYLSEEKKLPVLDIKESNYEGNFDFIRLEQVFSNLLLNSLRHGDGREVKICLERTEGLAIILFLDSGPGIPVADIEKVFDRFDRGSRRATSKGMGLGLYICKQIVEAHNGTIVALATEKGTSIEVRLPLI